MYQKLLKKKKYFSFNSIKLYWLFNETILNHINRLDM
jgi:hypothetical protein